MKQLNVQLYFRGKTFIFSHQVLYMASNIQALLGDNWSVLPSLQTPMKSFVEYFLSMCTISNWVSCI